MADLRHDMSHRGLKPEYARLEVRNIGFELVDLCYKLIDSAAHVAQMLKDNVVRFVSHDVSVANPGLTRQSILFQKVDAAGGDYDPACQQRGFQCPNYRVSTASSKRSNPASRRSPLSLRPPPRPPSPWR